MSNDGCKALLFEHRAEGLATHEAGVLQGLLAAGRVAAALAHGAGHIHLQSTTFPFIETLRSIAYGSRAVNCCQPIAWLSSPSQLASPAQPTQEQDEPAAMPGRTRSPSAARS